MQRSEYRSVNDCVEKLWGECVFLSRLCTEIDGYPQVSILNLEAESPHPACVRESVEVASASRWAMRLCGFFLLSGGGVILGIPA